MTSVQYDVALKQLKDRYDDNEYIIYNHYDALANLTRCKNTTDDLRQMYNVLETKIRSLKSLGENTESKHLVAVIKAKLPSEFVLKLEEIRDGTEWTVEKLCASITKLIVAREKKQEMPGGR